MGSRFPPRMTAKVIAGIFAIIICLIIIYAMINIAGVGTTPAR